MKVDIFIQTLPIMGYGMLGIFVVIGIIYLAVAVIGRITMKTKQKPAENA